ncbi:MAG TPA: hypothetical protein VNU46_04560 [Gemmatimonadaceae bacterium]|jgi:folate-binding protein YgfZ|nr:hypothetical protein [Gemmatimonadaceae bacterium]
MPPTLLFDRSDRTRLRFSGAHAVATLNGLVTNDVAALTAGQGMYAAVLTAKGKLVADLRIFLRDNGVVVDTSALAAPALRDMFKKYVNPRLATITDLTTEWSDLGVFGEMAGQVVAAATGASADALATLSDYGQVTVAAALGGPLERRMEGGSVIIARVPDLGGVGYELLLPQGHVEAVREALVAAGATVADAAQWHTLRVAAGRPEWGSDMDEATLPQEANFDALNGVSYTKGCYIGQETVARIHFRGHVNRNLRRLNIAGDVVPPARTELVDAEGKSVGDIRSTARLGGQGLIGLGMVRREIEDGSSLTTRWDGGEAQIGVVGLAPAS